MTLRRRLALCWLGLFAAAPALAEGPAAGFSENLVDRLEIQALMSELNGALLASTSATLTLERWCGRFRIADPAKITVRFPGGDLAASPETRERLQVDPAEPIRYRRVQLVCGDTVMSEADNWYVPGRLTAEMNAALDGSNAPFGKVVLPLKPFRRTVGQEIAFHPLPEDWELQDEAALDRAAAGLPGLHYRPEQPLFSHRALVIAADGRPISEVRETYLMATIAAKMRD